MALTIYVLFADDIKIMATARYVDTVFSVSYAVCFFIFIAELLFNSWCKSTFISIWPPRLEGYALSFFWWLDVISTISLLPDINFLAEPMGLEGFDNAGGGSQSYTQAGRVVRLVRLVRMVRLYRIASERRARKAHEEELLEMARMGVITFEEVEKQSLLYNSRQSRLGEQLSESTTKKVIIMILVLLIIIPILIYTPYNYGPEFGIDMAHEFNMALVPNEAAEIAIQSLLNGLRKSYSGRFLGFLIMDPTFGPNPYINFESNLRSVRKTARLEYIFTSNSTAQIGIGYERYYTKIIYNLNETLRTQAQFSIITTVFVGIMMVGGAVIFSNDADRLVIKPIERMMNLVEAVAANPLANFSFDHLHSDKAGAAGDFEIKLLESTVEKITGLLRVGFGEAGAGIISANLQTSGGGSATINPLLPGVRIYALFGFCDIHHFEEINRKLANDVLIFVNAIAEIVHSNVHSWSGQCNKNLGNAFVIVWRIGDEHTLLAQIGGARKEPARESFVGSPIKESVKRIRADSTNNKTDDSKDKEENKKKRNQVVDLRRIPGVDVLADHALIGYLKIVAEINRSRRILKYRVEPRLTDNGHKEFKVRMGFGLHAGWAIEGAVGSMQKVDATYLSPHVNMAARLETSSRQYGAPLLASQDFFDLMSQDGQTKMRRLDVVTVKGSEVPIGIYTYDAFQEQEFKDNKKTKRGSTGSTKQSQKELHNAQQQVAKKLLESVLSSPGLGDRSSSHSSPHGSGYNSPDRRPSVNLIPGTNKPILFLTPKDITADIFDNDYDMITLRNHVTGEFLEVFKEGVTLYLSGDWNNAKLQLERADSMMLEAAPALGGDDPSRTLLQYMQTYNFVPPKSWKGFRPLTSK
jgi:class 3 adenylate cyclase